MFSPTILRRLLDGVRRDGVGVRRGTHQSQGQPLDASDRQASSETTVPRAALRFAAAVPRGSGVLRHAPNALLPAASVCFAGTLLGAGRWSQARLVGLVARRPRRAPAGSPHLM